MEQIIAPLLIVRRVANRSVLGSDNIVVAHFDPFHVVSRGEQMGGGGISPGVNPMDSADEDVKSTGELEVKIDVEMPMEFRRGEV